MTRPKALLPRGGPGFIAKYREGVGTWNRHYLSDERGEFVRWVGGWKLVGRPRQEDNPCSSTH